MFYYFPKDDITNAIKLATYKVFYLMRTGALKNLFFTELYIFARAYNQIACLGPVPLFVVRTSVINHLQVHYVCRDLKSCCSYFTL